MVMKARKSPMNNFYYYVTQMIETHGPQMTLLFMGLFLAFMTMLKTSCYFGSSAIMMSPFLSSEKKPSGKCITLE